MRDPDNPRHPHTRRTDSIEGHSHTREEDLSFWMRMSKLAEKYRVLVYVIIAFLVALGFDFQTPGRRFSELQAQVDTLKRGRARQDQMMEFSVRYICAGMSPDTRYKLGGDKVCAQVSTPTP